MATDFFERQAHAQRSTVWLVALFVGGVLGIVGTTFVAVYAALETASAQKAAAGLRSNDPPPALAALFAGGGACALIGGGSLFKVAQLRAGGSVVAEQLGGRRVYPDSADLVERRLLNVVEEMALASGVPAPPVYLLPEEQGINAFAAGYAPSDAVVAVTRGCAEQLSREELQGVVAHEFSHILNGDMRLNIRLIGILHGILLIGLLGRILLRATAHSRGSSRDGKGGAAVLVVAGLAMFVLGYLGTLMGNLIKAAVSRQREYLADASAVQFTRNPGGLAGALKRIGAAANGSRLQSANAAEASHMFFAQGLWEGFTGLTATHPPLKERILRLEPQWDGKFPAPLAGPIEWSAASAATAGLAGLAGAEVAAAGTIDTQIIEHASDQVAEPALIHRAYAAALIASLPPQIAQSVREPYGARAVVLGLLLDRDPAIRDKQFAALAQRATPDLVELTRRLAPRIDLLDVRVRLPLVDLALPALRAMAPPQYRAFAQCFSDLVNADQRIGLFEWSLHRILLRHLRPQFEQNADKRIRFYGLQRLGRECSVLLSTLAHADNRRAEAPAAVGRGAALLPGVAVELLEPEQCGLKPLGAALDQLSQVAVKQRRRLIDACAACICADQEVTVAEAELLRGVCDMLDCPMPPLLPGQRIDSSATPRSA